MGATGSQRPSIHVFYSATIPCVAGYIVEGGVTRQPYGGHRISEALNTCLVQCNYALCYRVHSGGGCDTTAVWGPQDLRGPQYMSSTVQLYLVLQGT